MKKILLMVLTLGLSISLIGCNKEAEEQVEIKDNEVSEALDFVDEKIIAEYEEKSEKFVTCEDYYKDKIAKINSELQNQLSLMSDVFLSANFDVKGNKITYSYTFAEEYDPYESSLFNQNYDELIENTKDAIKFECGNKPETVRFIYLSSDGKVLLDIEK